MNNDKSWPLGNVPKVGTKYLKVSATGQIVEWKSYSENNHEYEVVSANGKTSKVHARDLSKEVTLEEELEFLRLKNKS